MFHRYLSLAQQTRLLSTVRAHSSLEAQRDYAWLMLLRSTGLRIGETSKLRVGQARAALLMNYLHVPGADRKGRRKPPAPRPGDVDLFDSDDVVSNRRNSLTLLVTRERREALELLLAVRRVMSGEAKPADEAPLILNRYGQQLGVRGFQKALAHWCKEAGFSERVSPHWLRHTRAMNIMKHSQSADPRGIVKQELGHASIESTAIYTRPTKEDVEAALKNVEASVAPLRKRDARRIYKRQLPLGIAP